MKSPTRPTRPTRSPRPTRPARLSIPSRVPVPTPTAARDDDETPDTPAQREADVVLLTAAIRATGLSARRFAVLVAWTDERTLRRYLAGERRVPGVFRGRARVLVAVPEVARALGILLESLEGAAAPAR